MKHHLFVCVCGLVLFVSTPGAQPAHLRSAVDSYIESRQQAIVSELVSLVSIPNATSDTENIRRNAQQLRSMLQRRGLRAEVIETDGNPIVYGELTVPQARRTLLIWAHYDGQPADPKGWRQTSAFTPVLRDGRLEDGARVVGDVRKIEKFNPDWRLYGRSAADDKSSIVALLAALDALRGAGVSPTSNIRVVLDGEEKSGSPSMPAVVRQHREKFTADLLLAFDGAQHQNGKPTIAFGFRGSLGLELTVYGPKGGAHSGFYGNWVPNPGMRLAHLLVSMRDEEGRVLVGGFYDGIAPLTPDEQAMLKAVPDDPASLMKQFAIAAPERSDLPLQDALQLPALNIRGLSSASVGADTRTIIPDRAVAAIEVRLVQETAPAAIVEKIRAHLRNQGYHLVESEPDDTTRARYPRIAKLVIGVGANGYRTSPLATQSQLLTKAVADMFGEQPVRLRTLGGTLYVLAFIEAFQLPAIALPIFNFDSNQNADNENLRLGHLFNGVRTFAAVLTM